MIGGQPGASGGQRPEDGGRWAGGANRDVSAGSSGRKRGWADDRMPIVDNGREVGSKPGLEDGRPTGGQWWPAAGRWWSTGRRG